MLLLHTWPNFTHDTYLICSPPMTEGGGGNVDDEGHHVHWLWLSMAERSYKPQLHQPSWLLLWLNISSSARVASTTAAAVPIEPKAQFIQLQFHHHQPTKNNEPFPSHLH